MLVSWLVSVGLICGYLTRKKEWEKHDIAGNVVVVVYTSCILWVPIYLVGLLIT